MQMKPLPAIPYEYARWKKARVNIDYHSEVDGHYYSVPYQLAKQQVNVRITQTMVEILFNDKRIAVHVCDSRQGRHTTILEHMPKSHQRYLEWTPSRLVSWAG